MSDRHYLVKFKWGEQTLFGVCEAFSDEAKEAAKRGNVIVAHAVLPKAYEVPEKDIEDIPLGDDDEFHQYVQAEEKKAMQVSDAAGDGVRVGTLFSTPVGDGQAFYVVTKVNKKTCHVEWRGFCLDRWVDRMFGWGGTFRIQDVAYYCGGKWSHTLLPSTQLMRLNQPKKK